MGLVINPGEWTTLSLIPAALQTALTATAELVEERFMDGENPAVAPAVVEKWWAENGKALIASVLPEASAACHCYTLKHMNENHMNALIAREKGVKRCACVKKNIHSELDNNSLVSHFDPAWSGNWDPSARQAELQEAVAFLRGVIVRQIKYYGESQWKAGEILRQGTYLEEVVGHTGEGGEGRKRNTLVLLEYAPWRNNIYDYEKETGRTVHWVVVFVKAANQWRCTAVPEEHNRFSNRALLAPKLRGLRGPAIAALLGLDPPIAEQQATELFVHHSGFTGGAPTREILDRLLAFDDTATEPQT